MVEGEVEGRSAEAGNPLVACVMAGISVTPCFYLTCAGGARPGLWLRRCVLGLGHGAPIQVVSCRALPSFFLSSKSSICIESSLFEMF